MKNYGFGRQYAFKRDSIIMLFFFFWKDKKRWPVDTGDCMGRLTVSFTCNKGDEGCTSILGGCISTVPFFLILTTGPSILFSSIFSIELDGCSDTVNSKSFVALRLDIILECSFWNVKYFL